MPRFLATPLVLWFAPIAQKLNDSVKDRIDAYRKENGLKENESVPADAVTASGSGLDPHISQAAAEAQISRVAKVRGMTPDKLRSLVAANTEGADLGFLGEPRVNVLMLNIALDTQGSKPSAQK